MIYSLSSEEQMELCRQIDDNDKSVSQAIKDGKSLFSSVICPKCQGDCFFHTGLGHSRIDDNVYCMSHYYYKCIKCGSIMTNGEFKIRYYEAR